MCLDVLNDHASEKITGDLTQQDVTALTRFTDMLQARRGRCISNAAGAPWTIYTDACYEPTSKTWKCGLGAILVSPDGIPAAMFSTCLSEDQMSALGARDKKSIIFEAEMLAMVLAIQVWRPFIGHKPVLVFIDNNSTRDVAISAKARGKVASNLVEFLLRLEDEASIWPWYSRVPSESNPADLPSRKLCLKIEVMGRSIRASPVEDELSRMFESLKL